MLAGQRRAEILNAAEKLLAIHGFDALRLRDVSEAAGVSIGLIQHHFATRDDLLLETMRVASRCRAQQWSDLARSAPSPGARVRALIEGAIGDHHRCIIWIETCAAATRHPELLEDVRQTQQAWHSTITAALTDALRDDSVPAHGSPSDTAELLIRLIDGFILDAAVGTPDPADIERRLAQLKEAANRILGGRWLTA
ncbi:TetR/AcrR family transcriptional regulator [Streptomyces sp. UH6]|uniref:TetR/AcrR family transcriptional regulator n=1 Tax=Streptomyces sp. UH6 TaxID=2748379 RepID=UPI0015D4C503|nr:TetR/AcrR family transcriptional regulator [Streptomyces sp. UH6]NYV72761.1 TetR family transcriptional regulator C-terminal domain-containing protein [Streptomyces sp. UH6]